MSNGVSKYGALWFFLAGVALIVFIQFISGKNNDRLLQGNRHLLHEVVIQNSLRQLEAHLLTLENSIQQATAANASPLSGQLTNNIQNVEKAAADLKLQLHQDSAAPEVLALNNLIQNRLSFGRQFLKNNNGTLIIPAERSEAARDRIIKAVNQIYVIRKANLDPLISSIESTGVRARLWTLLLAAVAAVACVLAFLYVINKGQQQQRVIAMLNESKKKIREAANIKEQFLANMSHEIRTPMNAILGFTGILKKTNLDTQQHQYVDYIYSSGENLLTLINDILDLSKIEAGMMNIEEAPFSLNGLILSVEIMFREKAAQKGIAFNVTIDPGVHDTLSGDAVRLTQILINLLSNAVKFTDKGAVELQVHSVKTEADDVVLQFSVKDTGVGIAPDQKQKIFERFQQAEAETTRRFGGTGLGLSIVKQLVTIQKGSIDVQSEAGKGSEFVVTLPFKLVHHALEERRLPISEVIPELKSVKILVAEDNVMNQQLIRHLMNQWQLEYQIVNNGKEAVNILKEDSFSIVLMDIQMPEMDGYAATAAIRKELELDLPIVAMTAHAMPGEKERCLSYGMNDYISKPVRDAQLYAILKQYTQHENPANGYGHTKIVNLSYLKEIAMGDEDFEQTIIQQFIVQVPEELKGLENAINGGQATAIKAVAHGMKSSVSYLGLNDRLHPVLHRIETGTYTSESGTDLQKDFEEVQSVCLQAIAEAKSLVHITV